MAESESSGNRSRTSRRLGWTMLGSALVALVAAAAAAVPALSFDTPRPGWALAARSLASLGAVLFAGGYALVMCSRLRRTEPTVIKALTRISTGAIGAAALIAAWQLLVVNDTVAPVVRVGLWVLVLTGIVATVSALIARWFMRGRDP